jgi:hypothetical protein
LTSMRIPHTGSSTIAIPVPLRGLGIHPDHSGAVLGPRVDVIRDEGGVVADEPDERGPARVLPRESDEEEAGGVRRPAPVPDAAPLVPHTGHVDPREVRSIPCRPDDRVDVLLTSVVEDRAPFDDARKPLPQGYA